MSYQISGRILKQELGGQKFRFRMPEDGADCEVSLTPWTKDRPWPTPGLEAYVIPGQCKHPTEGTFPVMLKVFKNEVPERNERTRFLTETLKLGTKSGRSAKGLPDNLHWMFFGFPFHWMGRVRINNTEVIAHLTRHIGGERPGGTADFITYKSAEPTDPICWDHVQQSERVDLALQLVDMARTLEVIGFVHGDLSHGNLLIGPGAYGHRVATLCDYDGYYYPRVSQLPRVLNGQPIRPVGTPEFQHPEINKRFHADTTGADAGLFVGTDRFAMGVLICEMMVWSNALKGTLVRDTLLAEADIQARSLQGVDRLAPAARKAFPGGFELLEKAMQATGMWNASSVSDWAKQNLPGPDEWKAKILQGAAVWPDGSNPHVVYYKQVGTNPPTRRNEGAISSSQGNFAQAVGAESPLTEISFTWKSTERRLELTFSGADEVRRRRGTSGPFLKESPSRPLTVRVSPGDHFVTGTWRLIFS